MTDASGNPPRAGAAGAASRGLLRHKRFLIAKPGLDGHDAGAKVIALALRDAGGEVIYTGLRKSPAYIARVAVDEDVDAVGLSVLSGSHCELTEETIAELKRLDAGDIPVFVGGTIPADDREALIALGVKAVYTSDQRIDEVIESLASLLA
jgi:methylmalonyl-CoA mutase, C-terminal domain